MGFTIEGREIETTAGGFLQNLEDWSPELAGLIALEEQIELSERHWDVINYLRDEYISRINRVIEDEVAYAPEQYFWLHRRFKKRAGMADPY